MIPSAGVLKKQPLKLDGITILDPDGRYLNDFVTEMEHHASLQVGDIAEFIKTGVYPRPIPFIVLPAKVDVYGKDADEEKTASLQHEADKQIIRMGAELQQQRRRMMHFILTHISAESKSKLEKDADYDKNYAAADPLAMWNLLLKLHRPGYNIASTEGQKSAANDAYFSLKMKIGQDLVEFRRDFVMARAVRKDCGNVERSETEAAWDFINRLDSTQYGGFQQFNNNQIAGGNIRESDLTFQHALKLVGQYKV